MRYGIPKAKAEEAVIQEVEREYGLIYNEETDFRGDLSPREDMLFQAALRREKELEGLPPELEAEGHLKEMLWEEITGTAKLVIKGDGDEWVIKKRDLNRIFLSCRKEGKKWRTKR